MDKPVRRIPNVRFSIVCSGVFILAYSSEKCLRTCAKYKDSDHPAHAQRITRAFALYSYNRLYQMILLADSERPGQTARMHSLSSYARRHVFRWHAPYTGRKINIMPKAKWENISEVNWLCYFLRENKIAFHTNRLVNRLLGRLLMLGRLVMLGRWFKWNVKLYFLFGVWSDSWYSEYFI